MAKNVFGTELLSCCEDPITGFYRNGCCDTGAQDTGMHTICILITEEFLDFSKSEGNDLSTSYPEYSFPGLKEGDRWCLCLNRWIDAYNAGMAPKINLKATHISVIEHFDLSILKEFDVSNKVS
jgi:uncharacterized protein (DUF2237 family)